jgi:hypothetical protein
MVTAFSAHISIACDLPGFSSFGDDPCQRIMVVLAFSEGNFFPRIAHNHTKKI